MAGVREACAHRHTTGYTMAAGFSFGAFVGYLTSAQQIFQEYYALGAQFPFYFGVLAVVGAASSFISMMIGTLIGQAYDGTVMPLIGGFACMGVASLYVMHWTERGNHHLS
ncbi:MAG: hypothetical protein HQL53_03655 [Magnetococcales bacterium]|nr:hypothetical protein [Magnetococcales bacterium]